MSVRTPHPIAPSAASTAMLVAVLAVAAPSTAALAADGDPDCRCRDPQGERRDLGTVTCVRIGRGDYLVRCEMSTNTPYWRRLDDRPGCPLAS